MLRFIDTTRARTPALTLAALLWLLPGSGAAEPLEVKGVPFERMQAVLGTPLEVKGAGLARWGGLFKVCAAALYGPPEESAEGLLAGDHPLRLEISYFVDLDKDRFVEAAVKTLRRQASPEVFDSHRPVLERLHRKYESVQEGDRYALSWHPDRGVSLELNGRLLGWVDADREFARFYFGIWLGEEPLNEGLREDLLRTP